MLTFEYAKNPVYMSEDGQVIDLMVKFEEFAEELPFAAMPTDPMPYGRDIYARAVAGEFGPVAPYVAAATPAQDQAVVQGAQTL